MIVSEAKTALARKLDIDYSDIANNDLFTDADLLDYIQAGVEKAWDYKDWTFKEDTKTTTATSDGYNDYPNDFEDESITRLAIEGEEWNKLIWDDYQKYLADNPTATDKIWSEHKRWYFYNTNACSVGDEIDVTGKLRRPTLSSASDLLPFSPTTDNYENSGNRAIIHFAYAEALASDKLKEPTKAAAEEKRAYGILDIIWKPIGARRAREQSKDRPFFDVPDFFSGRSSRNTNIGNFP